MFASYRTECSLNLSESLYILQPPLRHVLELLQLGGRYVVREVGAVDGVVLKQGLGAQRGEFLRGGFEERRAGDGGEFRELRDAAVIPDEVSL